MSALINLSGQRFGRLVVVERAGQSKSRNVRWLCRCDCGGETVTRGTVLQRGGARSCGCLSAEITGVRASECNATHGHSRVGRRSPTYRSWRSMCNRTSNPNAPDWSRYGGRGITVCDRWRDFANFLEDMGERPEGTSIDRIDVNGNYEPGNCRWATASEQQRNRRQPQRSAA